MAVACSNSVKTATVPAPTLAAAPTRFPDTAEELVIFETEDFNQGIDGWNAQAQEGGTSTISWDDNSKLVWLVQPQTGQAAFLARQWPALAQADGVSIQIESLDYAMMVLLGLHEADGSTYQITLPLSAAEPNHFFIDAGWLALQEDSQDENERLDMPQVNMISLTDISAFLGGPLPNRVEIDEISLWRGDPPEMDLTCKTLEDSTRNENFRTGMDASYVIHSEGNGHGYRAGGQPVDAFELFAANDADAMRVRLWVGEKGESKLEYATQQARRGQEAGLKPYLVLFLNDYWTDINGQPTIEEWEKLAVEQRADKIREYARGIAQHMIDKSIPIDFYEIGNEIDYGIAGVYAQVNERRDIGRLKVDIWPQESTLIKAAIQGVKDANPEARFMLHIANSWDPQFGSAFFRAMEQAGVEYDYIGLSYYPPAFGALAAGRLCDTLDRLAGDIGKATIIAESAYPAEIPGKGLFGAWKHPLPGYPLSPEGQAWWLRDLLSGLRSRPDVAGYYYFSPGFYWNKEIWAPFALFDGSGEARLAIGAFGER